MLECQSKLVNQHNDIVDENRKRWSDHKVILWSEAFEGIRLWEIGRLVNRELDV